MEWQLEEKRLAYCVEEIQKNIELWTARKEVIDQKTKDLYDHYHSGNPELESELIVSLDLQSETWKTLKRNMLAKLKPYFGRIDFIENGSQKSHCLYIGKNGITRDDNSILVTDWRAPVASVYYESNLGPGQYEAPSGHVSVDLKLKRTFEIENSALLDYYDSDIIANDEFLNKYLSKNKEVVLGEIIATIQKEQDEIIRDNPWHSVIVQGVAGSGKTTVAMHRISYLLYNYKDHFKPSEFYIIGSNRMLLNYITGVLPDLDVYNINQMTMEELFISLIGNDLNVKKHKLISAGASSAFKGGLQFILAFERFMDYIGQKLIPTEPVTYDGKIIMTTQDILSYLKGENASAARRDKSIREKAAYLNERLVFLLRNHLETAFYEPDHIRSVLRKYRNHFGERLKKPKLPELYKEFAAYLMQADQTGCFNPEDLKIFLRQLNKNSLDVYDLCMLSYMKNRILSTENAGKIKHMVIDEAQDFGVSIFYVLKKILTNCTFTIMGDISQNINYYTGMNDWSQIRNEVFSMEKDRFYVLAKSYRNTIEISEFAGRILNKCTFETYRIEPVIRHGRDVAIIPAGDETELVEKTVQAVHEAYSNGYSTVAVICRNAGEAMQASERLSRQIDVIAFDEENPSFVKGVMVLPIHLTKGLEFDAVVLYNPTEENYPETDADAKLLYVAATRALHQLHIVYKGSLSKLLQ